MSGERHDSGELKPGACGSGADVASERLALISWSAIAEPADDAAAWLVDTLGAAGALEWATRCGADPVGATHELAPHAERASVDKAVAASARWLARMDAAEPEHHLRRADLVGARAVTRVDAEWPEAFDVLGGARPYTLWVRGGGDVGELLDHAVAIVGSRASTAYGEHLAAEIAGGAGDAGWCVVSGGAYGIDGAAHRAALTTSTPTVAMMAGGVDRPYPAGHADLLAAVMRTGAIVSEVPVGYAPYRQRFLNRNRMIATAAATCVVEAAERSGALSTANVAADCGRPVGAVPGPVTSIGSTGCHRLIRDGMAVLVRSWADLAELAGPLQPDAVAGVGGGFANPAQRAAFDAIAIRGSTAEAVARGAGLTIGEVLGALAALELEGKVAARAGVWRRENAEVTTTQRGLK